MITGNGASSVHVPALQYGREMEPEAVETYYATQYCNHTNLCVRACGLYIDRTDVFACASPDALVDCDCCGHGLLEVKCPLKCVDRVPNDASLSYLHVQDGTVLLNRNHKYYTQIQCQIAVTNRQWCDFFCLQQKWVSC